ncbi:TIGR03086 family metal-binding protein [Nocardioides pyridinolyticus]
MTVTLGGSVGLLDQALAYTCARLSAVRDDQLDRRTPCAAWDLADLLAHMEDALDAFTEAAGGAVGVHGAPDAAAPVPALQAKARALCEVWTRPSPGDVVLEARSGRLDLDAPLLVATAALEIAVHGWDVGRATGFPEPLPDPVASGLLPMAGVVVGPADRGVRFAAPRPVAPDASAGARLLAFLGRG